ncbi:alpha-L-rhamnosidase [Niabella drilacis]|uniref:alpha-L-rhamnosidase n=1 Tax=Niabella drilacis (strain DSM 25811 / CCM 8410 / CCUG 62505 / LMG 26954 / E90) TaxID=1285928 RepID=UPI0015A0AD68|nr:alpha-L-rhamnosidase [Niabella drilacis]
MLLLILLSCGTTKQQLKVQQLKVEGRSAFVGVQTPEPRLSWQLQAGKEKGVKQVAYEIKVASSPELLKQGNGNIWHSGRVPSAQSLDVVFKGAGLKSDEDYYWQVTVWTNRGDAAVSDVEHWRMALLDTLEWKAKWIGLDTFSVTDAPSQTRTRLAARYLRKETTTTKPVKRVTAYISGLGLGELYINGNKISQDVLSPTLTDYSKRVPYTSYDITGQWKTGRNAIGVILGNGRYFNLRDFGGKPSPITGIKQVNYGFPRLLLQIRVTFADGTTTDIVSDPSWKVTDQGPIRANNEYDGETYDARMELSGWDQAGFDDAGWRQADPMDAPGGALFAQGNENIRINDTVKPRSVHRTSKGSYILDMGQNMVGWLQLKVKGRQNDTVRLVFAERLKNKDTLYLANLRDAQVTDTYVLKGGDVESWEPRFTYHGFRYVEISGLSSKPSLDDFTGKVVYDHVPSIGHFETSDSTINQIYHNAWWTIRGNYRGIPTDCPQRDERVAWLGDRLMSSYGESFLFDNARFYHKWMTDAKAAQSENGSLPDIVPGYWLQHTDNVTYPSAFIIIPEMLRKQFGDKTFREYYPYMKKWMLYMWNTYQKDDLVLKDTYGDWCVAPDEGSDAIWTNDPKRTTDGGLVGAAYYYYCATLMEKFAALQSLSEDVVWFAGLREKMKRAFNQKFFNPQKGYYANNTITANLLPLTFGLVPEEKRPGVFDEIVKGIKTNNNHVNSGIMGMMWLMRGLSDYGRPDLAYTIATNRSYPSWGYMVAHGATTIWELWNGNTADPLMNSWNHQMLLGDLLVWYYEYLAGIKSDDAETAFKKVIMNPLFPEGLDDVNASYQSRYGLIKSHWKKDKKELIWQVTIPPNSTAALYFPVQDAGVIDEGGKPVRDRKELVIRGMEQNRLLVEMGSGTYHFRVRLQKN